MALAVFAGLPSHVVAQPYPQAGQINAGNPSSPGSCCGVCSSAMFHSLSDEVTMSLSSAWGAPLLGAPGVALLLTGHLSHRAKLCGWLTLHTPVIATILGEGRCGPAPHDGTLPDTRHTHGWRCR